MTAAALGFLFLAALLHASWNLALKRTRVPNQAAFTLLFLWAGTLLFLPVVVWALWHGAILPAATWPWAAASVVLETLYWVLLTRSYSLGEMSTVYPLARGSGALSAAVLGILLLHERLTPGLVLGLALIVIGGYVLHLPGLRGRDWLAPLRLARTTAFRLALLTGLCIGLYTVADKQATSLGASLALYFWLPYAGPALLLTGWLGRGVWRELRPTWRTTGRAALSVGLLSPLTYLLVLCAMLLAPISRVAAAREISLVWGALLGRWVLQEQVGLQRLLGAGAIAAGVIALALAR